MEHPILLETERLTLRRFTLDDLDELFLQLSDPEVMRYYPAALGREESKRWLEGILGDYQANGFGMLAVCLKGTGEYVGQVGVMRRIKEGNELFYLSYLICKRFWGQGYASEAVQRILGYAFETLKVPKVVALIMPENTRSIRLAQRFGMERESSIEHNGCEHHVYTLTQKQLTKVK